MISTIPIENSGQVGILVASAISIFIVLLFVGLRLAAKQIGSRLDYSDYCIIAALVSIYAILRCCSKLMLLVDIQHSTPHMLYGTCYPWWLWLPYS